MNKTQKTPSLQLGFHWNLMRLAINQKIKVQLLCIQKHEAVNLSGIWRALATFFSPPTNKHDSSASFLREEDLASSPMLNGRNCLARIKLQTVFDMCAVPLKCRQRNSASSDIRVPTTLKTIHGVRSAGQSTCQLIADKKALLHLRKIGQGALREGAQDKKRQNWQKSRQELLQHKKLQKTTKNTAPDVM